MVSITSLGERGGLRLQLDAAKKRCQFKYETAIMLLHIHKVLLRAYHSMQSTLPCHHGSRGALQQQWGGENFTWRGGKKKRKSLGELMLALDFLMCVILSEDVARDAVLKKKRNHMLEKKCYIFSNMCSLIRNIYLYPACGFYPRRSGWTSEALPCVKHFSSSLFFISQDDYWGQAMH